MSAEEKVYKTPEYIRKAQRRYHAKHREDANRKNLECYYRRMKSTAAEECIKKRKV